MKQSLKGEKTIAIPTKSLEESAMFSKLIDTINSSLDIETVLKKSMNCVEDFMDAEASSIFETDKDKGEIFFRLARGAKGRKAKEIRLKMGEGIVGCVIQTGKPLIIPDARKDNRFFKGVDKKTGFVTKTILCVPLKARGEVIGAVQVLNKKNNIPFCETDLALLNSFSSHIAMALKNAMLYGEIKNLNLSLERKVKERTRELSLLLETTTTISSTLDLHQILQTLAEKMVKRVASTFCRIFFLDETGKHFVVQASYPIRDLDWHPDFGESFPFNYSSIFKKVASTKNTVVISNSRLKKITSADNERRVLTGYLKNIKSVLLIPLMFKDKVSGVISLGESRKWERSPFDTRKIRLCKAIANQAAAAIENAQLFEEVITKNKELKETCFQSMKVLAQSIEEKDEYTREHSERIVHYAKLLVDKLDLPEEYNEHLKYAAILHDIGKIGIRGAILDKNDPLEESEYNEIKTHPEKGAKLIEGIKFLAPVRSIILYHHERWDGTGYPEGLKGEEIPIGSRIISVLDTYDAITSDRPYRRAKGRKYAISELKKFVGKQFDPKIVEAFIEILKEEDRQLTMKIDY